MKPINTIIIDDEYFNRELVALLIQRYYPSFLVTGFAANIKEGVQLIHEKSPDVVFLDIKMPDGSGFDLLNKLENVNFEVVFVSGFDNYVLKALEFNALDYVLKPIDLDRFREALERVEARIKTKTSPPIAQIIQSFESGEEVTKIRVDEGDEELLIGLQEILLFQADHENTRIVKHPSEEFRSDKRLIDFEFILENNIDFIKVNDETFLNRKFISNYTQGSQCNITMTNNESIIVAERSRSTVLEQLCRTRRR